MQSWKDSQVYAIDAEPGPEVCNPILENYLAESTQRLESIADRLNRGEEADRDEHDWMLAQVDFIVETVGREGSALSEELRSNLLQLLLALANLNEQIRQHASQR